MLNHEKGNVFMEILQAADDDNGGTVDIKKFMAAIVDTKKVIDFE